MPETRTVRITRHYPASPEQVFDAWLTPALARRFLFSVPGGEMVRAEVDARVGGGFTFTDRRPGGSGSGGGDAAGGSQDVAHVGQYEVIERPRKLVFSFGVPQFTRETTRVTLDFAGEAGGCALTLTHEGVWADYAERTQQGWTMMLEGLGRALG